MNSVNKIGGTHGFEWSPEKQWLEKGGVCAEKAGNCPIRRQGVLVNPRELVNSWQTGCRAAQSFPNPCLGAAGELVRPPAAG